MLDVYKHMFKPHQVPHTRAADLACPCCDVICMHANASFLNPWFIGSCPSVWSTLCSVRVCECLCGEPLQWFTSWAKHRETAYRRFTSFPARLEIHGPVWILPMWLCLFWLLWRYVFMCRAPTCSTLYLSTTPAGQSVPVHMYVSICVHTRACESAACVSWCLWVGSQSWYCNQSLCCGVNSPDGQISRSNKATNYPLTNTHTYTHQPPAGFVETNSTCTCMFARQPVWKGVRLCVLE